MILDVPGMPCALRLGDIPDEVLISSGHNETPFSVMLHKMGQNIATRANAIVVNSFEELEASTIQHLKSMLVNHCIFPVGPIRLISSSSSSSSSSSPSDDPNGCLDWLDAQKPLSVVYISFGTVVTPPPLELAALAEAVEASGVPFIWSLPDRAKPDLPQGFLERINGDDYKGKVVSWAPQSEVLQHRAIAVFVSHGGWNSVLESLTGGVPMICRPFFGDHKLNAWLVSHVLEIGLGAKDGVFTKEGVLEALDMVLWKEEGKTVREKVGVLKKLAKQVASPHGSSTDNFFKLLKIVTSNNC